MDTNIAAYTVHTFHSFRRQKKETKKKKHAKYHTRHRTALVFLSGFSNNAIANTQTH